MRQLARAAVWLVLASLLVTAAPHASAATNDPSPGFQIVDIPDDENAVDPTPMARMRSDRVERIARLEAGMREAIRNRPGSQLELEFDAEVRLWEAVLRDAATHNTLARVKIDDRTARVVSRFAVPVGSYPTNLTERQAIDAAVADPEVRRVAKRWGRVEVLEALGGLDGCCWVVDFFERNPGGPQSKVEIFRVDVRDSTGQVEGVWTGHQIAWKMARGDREAFGGSVNHAWNWWPLFVVFALVAIDWTRVRSMLTLDVLAILAFGVSHELFQRGEIEWSVPLAMPPLLWLFGRSTWMFVRGLPAQRAPREPRTKLGRLALRPVPTMAIIVLCVALAGLRIGVTLDGGNVIDVGYAGVAGARAELDGTAPWGHMPADHPHGDTYGPANYLAYVPATSLLDDPKRDMGVPLAAAQATSIGADLLCALLLLVIGWRWISRRGGALLAAGWLACPWTTWALASGVNDALVTLPLLAAFAVLPRATLRGLFVGVAAMVKFAPLAVLAPLLHVGSTRRTRQALLAIGGASIAVVYGLAWVTYRLDGAPLEDLRTFWDRTLGFQAERGSPFSVWGLYGWEPAQRIAQGAVVLALVASCLFPRARDAWQVAAGAAAVLIAAQLVTTHWFYLYIPWFVGFTLLVLVAARERPWHPRLASNADGSETDAAAAVDILAT